MRQLSEAFAARLAAGGTSLCACWRFARSDGAVFGATDHDRAIVLDEVIHEPANGLRVATFESSAGLAPGRAMAQGVISAAFITEADLDAGLWDGAKVDVWRVDWEAPEHRVHIWSGRLSEIARQGARFTAELVSLKAGLERMVGRTYSRNCDADLGDARCGADLDDPAYRSEGLVTEALGPKRVRVSGLGGFDDGWFAGGVLSWMGGSNAGAAARVIHHTGDEIELAAAPRLAIEASDAFAITAGCNKSFGICGAKFSNQSNFRGFPHMPGPDAILAGPASDRANAGGRRG
jgi:uncharacterized phage protein (TIGR02218 family)